MLVFLIVMTATFAGRGGGSSGSSSSGKPTFAVPPGEQTGRGRAVAGAVTETGNRLPQSRSRGAVAACRLLRALLSSCNCTTAACGDAAAAAITTAAATAATATALPLLLPLMLPLLLPVL